MTALRRDYRIEGQDMSEELEDLYASALRFVLPVIAVLAVYVHFAFSAFADRIDIARFGFMGAVILAAGLAYWAIRYGVTRATVFLVAALAGILAVAVLDSRANLLAYWFSPLVIVAGVVIGWRGGVAVATLATAFVLVESSSAGAMPSDVTSGSLLLTWVSLLLAWLLSNPTRTALAWAWHSYVRAAQIMEELREHQAQLERTVKSLNLAYERLEQLNAELNRARRAADQARRLKAEFAAAISHELRTPLNLIIGFSEMMVADPRAYNGQVLPVVYRSDVEAIHRNACHLSSLVDDVLDLSQIEAERMGLQKEWVRIAPIVDEAAAVVAPLFATKGLALQVEVPLDLPPVYADRTRIRQVLINLLNNAVRFIGSGGVTIRGGRKGSDVIVAVADTGIGIAPENLSAVFDEFRQVHILGQRRVVGNGLGLAVSKRFVELHGGSIWVESQLGKGSTFHFSIPSCENVLTTASSLTEPRVRAALAANTAEPTILVIDRDREGEAARLFRRHLDGYRVVVAPSGAAARRLMKEHPVEAAILVGSDGPPDLATMRRLGELLSGVPILTCAFGKSKVSLRELGVADCLLKPVGQEQVRHALRRLGRQVQTILVVDDDSEMVRLLGRLISLASRRYKVWEAQSGSEALSLLETKRPDAVFLDLVMPDVAGDQVLRRMRVTDRLRDVPVVLVTGHGIEDETVTAEFLGIIQNEGFSVRELLRWLRTSLDAVHRPQTTLLQHLEQREPTDGFGQEVGCPHREGERPLVDDRADDDRDVAHRRIPGQDLQEFPAVANRHHQIERN
jgi:signal transduction histidine kinase/DNA-binding response OmpR family regulator